MKILTIVAAAAAAVLAVPAASAAPAAAPVTAMAAGVTADFAQHRGWGNDRRHRRAYTRTVCTRQWRHGHRVRVCRKVRAWR